ncbi:Uncharacterised protein [Tsukamurella pulmonis]|nr:Uncharacterised protein [Tsukamurella pulmonis]
MSEVVDGLVCVVVMNPISPISVTKSMSFAYHFVVDIDNPYDDTPIPGDVMAADIRRVSGEKGSADGLIEIPLFGHAHRYQVRVDLSGPAPRLVELRMIADSPEQEITPAALRGVPARRLTKAAARFITQGEHGIATPDQLEDATVVDRPDLDPISRRNSVGRRNLDDAHYRQVARLMVTAREMGEIPREHVAQQLGGVPLPTLDRWVREAKKRGFLARDWATRS